MLPTAEEIAAHETLCHPPNVAGGATAQRCSGKTVMFWVSSRQKDRCYKCWREFEAIEHGVDMMVRVWSESTWSHDTRSSDNNALPSTQPRMHIRT